MRPWYSKHMPAVMNRHATTEDVVFSMWPMLGSGMVKMCLWQQMNALQWRSSWRQCLPHGPCQGYITRTNWSTVSCRSESVVLSCIFSGRYLTTTSEQTEDFTHATAVMI
jgi:hypothetical protein